MMRQIDFLKSIPKTVRNVKKRAKKKTPEIIEIARKYGEEYFDGDRKYGYGGYYNDGRWNSVAKDFIEYYKLQPGSRVLDIGCAKGFLLKAFKDQIPDLYVRGIEISDYAIRCADEILDGCLYWASADLLPFEDKSFDLVISINTIHNLPRERAKKALQEIMRVSATGNAFVQVDSYYTPNQKQIFEDWVLTAMYHDYPDEWLKLFKEAGYVGDYNWTVV